MNHVHLRASAVYLVSVLLILLTSACAVPLAPGYRIVKETQEIKFIAGQPAALEIHASRTLQNNGTAPLNFIDITFPEEKPFGRKNIRVEVDGREARLAEVPPENQPDHPNDLRVAFDTPWARGRTLQLTIDYELSQPEDSGTRETIGEDDFHLGSRGWSALPQPPAHFMATIPTRPDKSAYSIRVPGNFLMLARGKVIGRKKVGSEIDHHFRLRTQDLAAFVVAGDYRETAFHPPSGEVIFWTHGPLKGDVGTTPEKLAAAWRTLETDFGPIDPNIRVPHIVESSELREHFPGETGAAASSFPGGALVNEEALALGIESDEFVEHVTHALAHDWFGDAMYMTSEAAIPMGEGLPDYATIVVDEARNEAEARKRRIADYLRRYEQAASKAAEKPLGVTALNDPPEQREIALEKAPLMYAALEDTCGETPVRNGLKDLVTLLHGQEAGINDMRSAIEQQCGKDLGEFFRVWLYGKGLPGDFRARYQATESHN